jgi:mRNA interferase RelE/StbE
VPVYSVQLLPAARRQLRRLDTSARDQILDALTALTVDPRPSGVKALAGSKALLRVRTGDYRIVYQIEDQELLVLVIALGHRREVYSGL